MKGNEDIRSDRNGMSGLPEQHPPDARTQTDISALLRLKRYEQPPPAYFESFLQEFHRRQRSDMLRVSPMRLWWERVQASFQGVQVGSFAYGGAAAAFAVVFGLMAVQTSTGPSGSLSGSREVAAVSSGRASVSLKTGTSQASDPRWGGGLSGPALASSPATLGGDDFFDIREKLQAQQRAMGETTPVYVLDSRPVSYEAPFSF